MRELTWGIDSVILASIAIAGLVVLVVLLIADAATDVSLGHDGADVSNSPDVDTGPIAVNTQMLFAFLTGFGATGWVMTGYFGIAPIWSTVGAMLLGAVVSLAASFMYQVFKRNQSTSGTDAQGLVGAIGVTSLEVPQDGFGRIMVTHGGQTYTFRARSDKPVLEGTRVKVTAMSGDVAQVQEEPGFIRST